MAKPTTRKILSTKTSQLPVYLTDVELREAGKNLARLKGELEAHEQKAKEIREDLKARESTLEGQARSIALVIRQGYEHRPVPVRIEADFKGGKVYEIREDTGEVIAERAVNEQDRQASIFDGAPVAKREVHPDELVGTREEALRRAALEEDADKLLKNAGNGALTKKELKGAAVARKAGVGR